MNKTLTTLLIIQVIIFVGYFTWVYYQFKSIGL